MSDLFLEETTDSTHTGYYRMLASDLQSIYEDANVTD